MFKLKDIIFSLFGVNAPQDDVMKVNGKGFNQRFNELLAGDMDDNEITKTNEYCKNLIAPDTLLSRFIPLRFECMGGYDYIMSSIGLREEPMRKILKYWLSLVGKKGTMIGYKSMFRMIGIDGTILIEEYGNISGFDSPVTLDDSIRRFDGSLSTCSDYSITLFGSAPYTTALAQEISAVIIFNEPINARLIRLSYNETVIPPPITGRSYNDSYNISYK